MTALVSAPFAAPGSPLSSIFGAGGSTTLTPGLFPVALAGVPYLLDESQGQIGLRFTSGQRIRQQADASQRPGEQSLNPEGDWRRSFHTWKSGAGQDFADHDDSLFSRFRASKGINVWEDGQICLLNDTTEALSTTETNLYMADSGSRLYVTDGQTTRYTTDLSTFNDCTGTPAVDATGIASAGHHVFIAYGASGIYHTELDTAACTSWVTGTVEGVWYAKGRVITANQNNIYNPTTSWTGGPAALPSALLTHPNDEWTWVDVAEGLNHIYMGGTAGDTSEIYRTEVKAEGTALAAPIVAGRLPEGEVLTALDTYLTDFVLIGTSKGVRIANADANGDLLIGPLIETGQPVNDFEGQGQFVWFTWQDFDVTSGGLGRIDLTEATQRGAPAYASDLMHTTTADITSVITFDDKRVFGVAGDGFYTESTNRVASGWLDTGEISFGLTEHKLAKEIVVTTQDFSVVGGSIQLAISTDRGTTWTNVGESISAGDTAVVSTDDSLSASHAIRITLTRDATDTTLCPVTDGISLRVHPHTDSTQFWTARLLMAESVYVANGYYGFNLSDNLASVSNLHTSQSVVSFQALDVAYQVTVEDFEFLAMDPSPTGEGWSGTLVVRLKVV